jgi:hypothetical protein
MAVWRRLAALAGYNYGGLGPFEDSTLHRIVGCKPLLVGLRDFKNFGRYFGGFIVPAI